jgi:hypothetical protein
MKKTNKINKTNILPLRWIGNICGEIAINSLVRAFALQDQGKFGYRFKFHSKVWSYLNKPYMLWGTFYEVVLKS